MQVVYKGDVFFIWIYSAIIAMAGLVLTLSSQHYHVLVLTAVAVLLYLFFATQKIRKRLQAVRMELPQTYKDFLQHHSMFYASLSDSAKLQFEKDVQLFLCDYSIIGIRQQQLTDEIILLVAAGVAAMLHGRPDWQPPIPDGILVYPGDRFNREYELGKGQFAGMAARSQPLILTEGSLQNSLENPNDGFNVVIHELAHYFDLEDGEAEGIPSSRLSFSKLKKWQSIIQSEWQKVLQGKSFLRDYAGANEAEFFAVACESFFEKPWEVETNNPELYQALVDFFNLDTLKLLTGPS